MTDTLSSPRRVAIIAVGGRDPCLAAAITKALAVIGGSTAVDVQHRDAPAEPRPKGPLTQAIERVLGDAPSKGEVTHTHYAHVRGKEPFDPYGIFKDPQRPLLRGTW